MAENGRFIDARYAGRCYGCEDEIQPGDRIFYGEGRSWHAECAEAEFDVEDKDARGRR